MSVAEERARAVAETVEKIREVERDKGVTRASLEEIKGHLMALASREELFPMDDFPMPGPGDKRNSCLYRLSEDDDHRFALYANAAKTGVDTPAHNHTTWAAIVGVRGEAHNRFYRHTEEGGVEQTGEHTVGAGTGVAFMPEDLHSIHIHGDVPVLNFHMYGVALEQLHKREYYKPEDNTWHVFPAHSDIREARADKVGA